MSKLILSEEIVDFLDEGNVIWSDGGTTYYLYPVLASEDRKHFTMPNLSDIKAPYVKENLIQILEDMLKQLKEQ